MNQLKKKKIDDAKLMRRYTTRFVVIMNIFTLKVVNTQIYI